MSCDMIDIYWSPRMVNKQLLDAAEQNIVICLWRADQLFADAERDNVFMHLTSTLVSRLFIPTPSARFHFVQNLNILHKKIQN